MGRKQSVGLTRLRRCLARSRRRAIRLALPHILFPAPCEARRIAANIANARLSESAGARRSTFTLTKYLQSYIPRFPRREMSFARAGKTAANEAKYPFIVEVPIAANGLNVELNRQIVGFHKLHHTTLRFGRTALRNGQIFCGWCFFDLATARAFAEQFGGAFYKTIGT